MNKYHTIKNIPISTPQQILRIKVEANFGETEAVVEYTSVKILGYQATTTTIESEHPPESVMVVKPITVNGIFDNEFYSSVCIARDHDEVSCIELNFISDTGSNLGSLLIPPTEYSNHGSIEHYYCHQLIDQLTQDRISTENTKDFIEQIVLDTFFKMTGVSNFIHQDWEVSDEH
jgi:hypothetical protein